VIAGPTGVVVPLWASIACSRVTFTFTFSLWPSSTACHDWAIYTAVILAKYNDHTLNQGCTRPVPLWCPRARPSNSARRAVGKWMRHCATRREVPVSIPRRVPENFQMTYSFCPQSAALTLYQKWVPRDFLWGKVWPLVFMTCYGKNLEQIRTSETVCKQCFKMCWRRIHQPYIRLTWICIVVAPGGSVLLSATCILCKFYFCATLYSLRQKKNTHTHTS